MRAGERRGDRPPTLAHGLRRGERRQAHCPEVQRGPGDLASQEDAKLAQLQPFIPVSPQECVGQLASFVPA